MQSVRTYLLGRSQANLERREEDAQSELEPDVLVQLCNGHQRQIEGEDPERVQGTDGFFGRDRGAPQTVDWWKSGQARVRTDQSRRQDGQVPGLGGAGNGMDLFVRFRAGVCRVWV